MAAADTPPFAVNNPDEDEEGHKPSYAAVASGVAHADDLVVEEAEELDAPLLKAESAVGAGSFGPHPGSLTASVGNNNKQQDKPQQQPSAPAATAGFRPPLPAKPAPRTKTVVKNAAGVHALSAGEKCIQGITNPITCVVLCFVCLRLVGYAEEIVFAACNYGGRAESISFMAFSFLSRHQRAFVAQQKHAASCVQGIVQLPSSIPTAADSLRCASR